MAKEKKTTKKVTKVAKAEWQKAYETAKIQTIAPLVSLLRNDKGMNIVEAKEKALASREEGSTFEDFWKSL